MKRLILSVLAVVMVSSLTFLVTQAYFTDTEESVNNTFTTGTIDIAVDDTNPWTRSTPYTLDDMKPGYVDYITFEIENVGSNPANVWKNIEVTERDNEPVSEPECAAEVGTWTPGATNQYLGTCSGNTAVTDLENVIDYDLKVKVYDTPTHMAWEQILYDEDVELGAVYTDPTGRGVFLGMLPSGWTMSVEQSYRMQATAGNEYQGDEITFDINLFAEQLINTVVLEDKDTTDWQVLSGNGKNATLTYGAKEATFDYTLNVAGMTDGAYTLVAWEDSTYTWTWGSFAGTTVLANVTVSGGAASVTGSVDLGTDLTNSKVWLVPGTLGTPGQTGVSLPWNPGQTLFETGLMDYYDSL